MPLAASIGGSFRGGGGVKCAHCCARAADAKEDASKDAARTLKTDLNFRIALPLFFRNRRQRHAARQATGTRGCPTGVSGPPFSPAPRYSARPALGCPT